jgi:universal stress protein A
MQQKEAPMAERFAHILVPIDFNPASDAALVCARDIAERFGARLTLLHVVTDPNATGFLTPEMYVPASLDTQEMSVRGGRERLERLASTLAGRVPFTIDVRIGDVVNEIKDFVRNGQVDLIVMGTHGRRGLAHLFLGSVAEEMLRTSPCPVLTMRAQAATAVTVEDATRVHAPVA